MTQHLCWFTHRLTETESANKYGIDGMIFKSDACGTYIIPKMFDVQFSNTYQPPNNITQGSINCAKHNLEVQMENPKTIPVWLPRNCVSGDRAFERENLTLCIYEDYLEQSVDHSAKSIKLLEIFSYKLRHEKAYAKFNITIKDRVWAKIVDTEELIVTLRHLESKQLILIDDFKSGDFFQNEKIYSKNIQMTVQGWEAIRVNNTYPNTNKVFIATQFEWPGEHELWNSAIEAIKRACSRLGYEASIVDQNHTGNITDRIIGDIKKSRFVIAEFTYNNRGVYYEAGLARKDGIPVFHLVREGFTDGSDQEGKKLHFDLKQIMYRMWKTPADLETQLYDWIDATVGKFTSF